MSGAKALFRFVLLPFGVVGLVVGALSFFAARLPSAARLGLGAIVVLGFASFAWKRYRFWRLGYRASRWYRDEVRYEEIASDAKRFLTLDGQMLVGAPHLVYIPEAEAWEAKMPAWARGRRDQIISRIKAELGTVKYDYVRSRGVDA